MAPKCVLDRGLAIAHGLEEVFWYQDENGKGKRHEVPAEKLDALIAERTFPAVKAAM